MVIKTGEYDEPIAEAQRLYKLPQITLNTDHSTKVLELTQQLRFRSRKLFDGTSHHDIVLGHKKKDDLKQEMWKDSIPEGMGNESFSFYAVLQNEPYVSSKHSEKWAKLR